MRLTTLVHSGVADAFMSAALRRLEVLVFRDVVPLTRGSSLIEAFDQVPMTTLLRTMRGLDLFSENSIGHYYSIALRNKLSAILEPLVSKPARVRAKRKPRTGPAKRRPAEQLARMAA